MKRCLTNGYNISFCLISRPTYLFSRTDKIIDQLQSQIPQKLDNKEQKKQFKSDIMDSQKLLNSIIQEPPTYSTFRKYEIDLSKAIFLLDNITSKDISGIQQAIFINNLLTYTRKNWGKSLVKSNEKSIQTIVSSIKRNPLSETSILPALIKNIEFSYSPEQFLDQVSQLVIQYASQMPANEIANCLYGIAKIARKRVQDIRDPKSQASIQKTVLYNSAQLAAEKVIPMVFLKDWNEIQTTLECLIAYQKLEMTEEQNIGAFLLKQITQILQKNITFDQFQSQLVHTVMKYQENPIKNEEFDQVQNIMKNLYEKFQISLQKLNINSICLSVCAFVKFDASLVSTEVIELAQQIYCEKETQANIQDLAMLLNASQRKGIILSIFSRKVTEHYELLRSNVDINVANYIMEYMGDSINQRFLEKKFLNMFLISVKILHDKDKINQKFVKQFIKETKKIENQEIQEKFQKIQFILTHK